MIQCDEARPTSRSCVKARLACDCELAAGKTRIQALLANQQRLQEELHSYASLIHTLRCVDSGALDRTLEYLRRGDYDAALLGMNPASRVTVSGDSVYPWEDSLNEYQQHPELNCNVLPPIDALLSVRYNRATYSTVQPLPVTAPSASVYAFTATYKPLSREES
jgi:hypothetical protein